MLQPGADEIVVVDQSDPGSAERVRRLCDGGIRRVGSEPRGVGHARKLALEQSRTDLLLFTDDDCLVRPGWAGGLAAVFAVHPRAGAAVGAVRPHPSHPLPPGIPEWVTEWGGARTHVFTQPTDPSEIGGCLNMAFRVSALRAAGGFDERLGPGSPLRNAEDADAVHRVLRGGWQVVYTPEAIVSHRPPRDLAAHQANERSYAFGLGAWAALAYAEGDRLPRSWWKDAMLRATMRAFRRAPFEGPRPTAQRLRIAADLLRGWRAGARTAEKAMRGSRG